MQNGGETLTSHCRFSMRRSKLSRVIHGRPLPTPFTCMRTLPGRTFVLYFVVGSSPPATSEPSLIDACLSAIEDVCRVPAVLRQSPEKLSIARASLSRLQQALLLIESQNRNARLKLRGKRGASIVERLRRIGRENGGGVVA